VRASATRSTCAATPARRGASSAGRRSSTSATARCGRTRSSTRTSRRRCSICRCRRSPAASRRRRSRSATCSGGITWSLPSGQAIARRIGATPLAVNELRNYRLDLEKSTPLFYYTLKEAEVVEGGLRLGPVGGTVVAEVFVGLLQSDPSSWVRTQPNWRPTLPPGSNFRMVDFLRFANVDPASRGQ
jgi:hypothetical protein